MPSSGQVNILCMCSLLRLISAVLPSTDGLLNFYIFSAFMRFIGKEEICLTSLLAIGKLHARTDLDIRISEQM